MLKAYDYAEPGKRAELRDAGLFRQEKQIAQQFVLEHPSERQSISCPICGSIKTKYIFERWDVNYRLCDDCKSIFVAVDDSILQEYLGLKSMKNLRVSSKYQQQASERRTDIWMDFVSWAEYRVFRYLGRNRGLRVIDFGNRYVKSVELFRSSKMTAEYELRDSILPIETASVNEADLVLYLNQLQHEADPIESLLQIGKCLSEDGLLILNTRLGSGFDILTLKGGTEDIFPYEHIMLPSAKGLKLILDKAGYELLEITTPGTRDLDVVMKNKERIEEANFFIKYLIDTADCTTIADFQQFLQKSGLSSFAQVIAKKKD